MLEEKVPVFGVRHIQVAFLVILTTLAYATRANLSLAIVAMTEKTSQNPNVPIYEWSTNSIVLSSFFWTYFVLQIHAGQLSRQYGAKIFLMTAMLVNILSCILTPIMATLGPWGVITCRLLQGLAQGCFYPICYNILASWSPIAERSTMASLVICGNAIGTIICTPFVGFISASWIGWPASFYILGSLGFMWIIMYYIFGAECPRDHKSISEKEIAYIEFSGSKEDNMKVTSVPWKSIFTSLPVWAILVAYVGQSWSFSIIFNEIPTYISKVMKFSIESNGLLSAAPHTASLIIGLCVGPLSDFMINKGCISLLGARRLFTILGCAVSAIPLVLLGYIPEDQKVLSVFFMIVAIGFSSFAQAGMLVNHLDIAPNHAGLLMGITNGASCVVLPFPPLVIQYTITNEEDQYQWRTQFIISAVLLWAATLFYVIFAAAHVQWWNSSGMEAIKDHDDDDEEISNDSKL